MPTLVHEHGMQLVGAQEQEECGTGERHPASKEDECDHWWHKHESRYGALSQRFEPGHVRVLRSSLGSGPSAATSPWFSHVRSPYFYALLRAVIVAARSLSLDPLFLKW